MKKILAMLLAVVMVFGLAACGGSSAPAATQAPANDAPAAEAPADEAPAAEAAEAPEASEVMVAMITDYGDITDQSFNQTTYEACKAFCEDKGMGFSYFKPASDSDDDRISMIEKAIDEGYTVIVMPGYAFENAIVAVADEYPEVTFIAIDVSMGDHPDYQVPANLYCCVYKEELCGYMAGVAAVKLGYTKLGFLGGMAVPAVIRYGYGFVQGADAAAAELGKTDVEINYAYGNQFYGDADITAAMDTWYGNGTEIVFACGGGIYTSAGEAAQKVGGKVIGVDSDQAPIIDGMYGEGMTVTSAMKGLTATVNAQLGAIVDGSFEGGKVETLGLVSLADSTQYAEGFTAEDYQALIAGMADGSIVVSNDTAITAAENATVVTVNDLGNLK